MNLEDLTRIAQKNLKYFKDDSNNLILSKLNEEKIKSYESIFINLDYHGLKSIIDKLDLIKTKCNKARTTCGLMPIYEEITSMLMGAIKAGMKDTPELERIEETVYLILRKNEELINKPKSKTQEIGSITLGVITTMMSPLIIYSLYAKSQLLPGLAIGGLTALAGLTLLTVNYKQLKKMIN